MSLPVSLPRRGFDAAEFEGRCARAQALMREHRRGVRGFDPATDSRIVRFATPDDLEFVLVPLLLERLSAAAPNMRLVVRPSDFRTLLDRLDSGRRRSGAQRHADPRDRASPPHPAAPR